jgi:hypothetical protein
VSAVDIVDALIVAFGDDRERNVVIDADARVLRDEPIDHTVVDAPDVERIGQRDRDLEKPRFVDPMRPGHLAVAVEGVGRGGDAFAPGIVVGQYHRDPRAHRTRARHERARSTDDFRDLPDEDARDIRDRIERTGGEYPAQDRRRVREGGGRGEQG